MPERAVFDCMLFLQAVLSDRGPAFECFSLAEQGQVTLCLSPAILTEVEDVLTRPPLRSRFPVLTSERVKTFIEKFKSIGALVPPPPKAFALPRDPKDEPYTDLAIAVNAAYLVTWNERHLTYLMARDTPEGQEFCHRFPGVTILPPPAFLQKLREGGTVRYGNDPRN